MKSYFLYDYFETTEDGDYFRQLENADRFDPDPFEQAITGEYGICVVSQFQSNLCVQVSQRHSHTRNSFVVHRTQTTSTSRAAQSKT